MSHIYTYTNDFDRSVVYDKISKIEEEIEEASNEMSKEEFEKKRRELMYAQLMQGLRLNTGFYHF